MAQEGYKERSKGLCVLREGKMMEGVDGGFRENNGECGPSTYLEQC